MLHLPTVFAWLDVLGTACMAAVPLITVLAVLYVTHSLKHFGRFPESRQLGRHFTVLFGLFGLSYFMHNIGSAVPALHRADVLLRGFTAVMVIPAAVRLWVTMRNGVGRRVREEAQLLHALTEGTADGYWDWDLFTGENVLSPQYLTSLGYLPGAFPPTMDAWEELLHPDDVARVWVALEVHLRTGEPYSEAIRFRHADDSYRWRLDRGCALRTADGHPYRMVGTHTDITHIKLTEDALRRTNGDLEQFAYSASHDLQEPLRMIAGWTSALFEDYGDRLTDTKAKEMRDFIIEGVARMHQLIDDLLSFSRAGRNLRRQHFPLMRAVNMVVSSLALTIKEAGAEVVAGDLPTVYGDPGMLAQVLQNLISNSLKYRDEGRSCVVSLSSETVGPLAWIHVSDNGIGIPVQYRQKVFEVFTRLYSRERYSGNGIGLALVRRIVHAHGGQVTISSGPGDIGTTVSFSLPLDVPSVPFSTPQESRRDA